MMPALILIGHWSDTPEYEGDLIHPQYLRDRWTTFPSHRRLVNYIKSGLMVFELLGYSFCRLPEGPPRERMGCAYRTDGVWIWPEGFWVYVEQFGVEVPTEFIRHAEHHGYAVPDNLDAAAIEEVGWDDSFWEAWCRKKKSERL